MQQEPGSEINFDRYRSVQARAYRLWEQRGRPWGTPETDWFKAEEELRADKQNPAYEATPVAEAARVIGSLLGSVAGFVTSIADSIESE